MKRVVFGLTVMAALLAAACTKSSTAAPTPTVSSLALSPATDLIKTKGTEKFSATATLSSGAVESVTATWTSDNAAVATVDAAGTVTGVAPGRATIVAAYQGKTATRALRVVPDYGGRWSGSWAVSRCAVSGGFRSDWCNPLQGNAFPATLDLTQTRDVTSGTWALQDSNGTVQGTIADSGVLSLTGSSLQSGVTITISAWQSTTADNRTMTGTFTLTWTVAGLPGSAQTDVTLQNFTKQ